VLLGRKKVLPASLAWLKKKDVIDETEETGRGVIVSMRRNNPNTSQKVLAMDEKSDRPRRASVGRIVRIRLP